MVLKSKRMKTYNLILGVDVSKLTLDISCAKRKLHIKIENDSKGFSKFKTWCRTNKIPLSETMVIMEHTGGYEYRFIQFCESVSLHYCRISGLEIKRSMGITRGKNDKVDSYRIGLYGEEKIARLKPSKPLDRNILSLKQLLSFRKRLVRENAGLSATIKERQHIYETDSKDAVVRIANLKIRANADHISQIEKEIDHLIKSSDSLSKSYRILTSVKGIGPINALMTIAYTENFISFTDPRKYAVYVGVVPFDNTSGTSIKGKKMVSYIANKELKQELNQAAKSAVTHDPELRAYAQRKIENKHYKIVLNNVKFKLILRMFAVIKRGELYTKNFQTAA